MTAFKASVAILLSVSVLTGCPSSNDENTSDKKNLNVSTAVKEDIVASNTTINEMGRPYIVTLNASGDKSNEYVSGGYFLAPLIKYSTVGLISTAQESSINDDGTNYLALSNIFETSLKTMQLDLYYSSEDSRDKFNKLFGLWRTSFTSYVDFKVDYDNANIKSRTYDTPRNACESGFEDIKSDVYRALLQDAHTVYDESISLCIIRNDNMDVGSFNVWNKETGIVGDFHYLTLPSGETIVFKNDGDKYIGDDRGLVVNMRLLEDDSFEYIDAQSVVNTYSKEGKLIRKMFEGQETIIHYDDQFKITHITGPLDSSLVFNYSEDQLLQSITFAGKQASFRYNEDNFLIDISVATDDVAYDDEEDANTQTEAVDEATDLAKSDVEKDLNIGEAGVAAQAIENVYNLATFTYNDQELLASINRVAVTDDDNPEHSISASSTSYFYDNLKRVVNIEEDTNNGFSVTYQASIVEKSFKDGNKIIHNLSFVGSKQQVKLIDDNVDLLVNEFNKQGQLSQIDLTEEPEIDEHGNIITQGLENGKQRLKMNFSYNTRGLINKIQYASVSSGKRFVQLDYKSHYPKPTKVLTNDAVTFFDINQKGQIIRKTAVK
ncbi:MAG: hypothetical protein HRU25_10295, partial [Psychrobium sp.]|nr:hypothetical protein [Psychrobium sp.]